MKNYYRDRTIQTNLRRDFSEAVGSNVENFLKIWTVLFVGLVMLMFILFITLSLGSRIDDYLGKHDLYPVIYSYLKIQ